MKQKLTIILICINIVYILDGTVYPKGIGIVFFVYYMHRRPDLFRDPELFNPDRYLPENMKLKNPFTYVPFSAGPRNCIGKTPNLYLNLVKVKTGLFAFGNIINLMIFFQVKNLQCMK